MAGHAWQTDFPLDEAKAVANALMSKTFTSAVIPQGWIVAEFLLGQFMPPGVIPALRATGPVGEQDSYEAGQELMSFCQQVESQKSTDPKVFTFAPSAISIPWMTIVKAILQAVISVL